MLFAALLEPTLKNLKTADFTINKIGMYIRHMLSEEYFF